MPDEVRDPGRAATPQGGPPVVRPRVAILGSCVSRDIFNLPDAQARFEVVDYYARSSLASLVSRPWASPLPLERIEVTRKGFIDAMQAQGIGIGVSYEALHLTTLATTRWGYRAGMFPNAERIGRETVTLPLFPAMADDDVDRVVAAMRTVLVR